MKRFVTFLSALAVAVVCALPSFAAGPIQVTEDISVSGDYDWTRFAGQNVTLNVYNWGRVYLQRLGRQRRCGGRL